LAEATDHQISRSSDTARAMKMVERVVKQSSKHAALSSTV
jgi:hypothetical protein